jgi:hypothetical protein
VVDSFTSTLNCGALEKPVVGPLVNEWIVAAPLTFSIDLAKLSLYSAD